MKYASLTAAIPHLPLAQVMRCDYSSYSNEIACTVVSLCYASRLNISWLKSLNNDSMDHCIETSASVEVGSVLTIMTSVF